MFKKKKVMKEKRDLVFIKRYSEKGEQIETYNLSEDDYFDYFGILEGITKKIKSNARKIKKQGFKDEKDKEEFDRLEKTLKKIDAMIEKANTVAKINILCFEGDKKENDFIEIKVFNKKEELEDIHIIKYEEVEGYIKILSNIFGKLGKISELNPLKSLNKENKGNKIFNKIIKKAEKFSKIKVLVLRDG
jgi:hypothetical protein